MTKFGTIALHFVGRTEDGHTRYASPQDGYRLDIPVNSQTAYMPERIAIEILIGGDDVRKLDDSHGAVQP